MAKLTTTQRNSLPPSSFALPKERRYPVEDKNHARNALARVSQGKNLSEEDKMQIIRKAHAVLARGKK